MHGRLSSALLLPMAVVLVAGALTPSCGTVSQGSRLTFLERADAFLPDDGGSGTRTLEIGDLTGDGLPDVAVGNTQGVAVWSRSGTSRFQPQLTIQVPNAPGGVEEIRVVDLDGDGDPDLALTTGLGDLALWIHRTRLIYFDETQRRLLGVSAPVPLTLLRVVDVDGDGAPDLFLSGAPGTEVLLNRSEGQFRNPSSLLLPPDLSGQTGVRDVAFADLDGDGNLDLVGDFGRQLELFRGREDGSFRVEPLALPPPRSGRPFRITLVDVDGDGDLDIVACVTPSGSSNGGHLLLINDGTGHFSDKSQINLPSSAAPTFDVLAEDLDLDGDQDLLFATGDTTGAELFLNDGSGRFDNKTFLLPPLGAVSRLRSYDIDGDGDPDVLAIRPGKRTALLLNGLELGITPTPTAPPPSPTATPEPSPSPTRQGK